MSYRNILARTERKRPDGSPVWPLRDADLLSSYPNPSPIVSAAGRGR